MAVQVTEIDIEAVQLALNEDGLLCVSLKMGPAGLWLNVIQTEDPFPRPIEVSAAEIENLAMGLDG